MKLSITKDWFISRAHLEEGREIGAGSLQFLSQPVLRTLPTADHVLISITQRLSFGRFVALMRRKQGWSVPDLAAVADISAEELLAIERDPHYEPELSTVCSLADSFELPQTDLIKMSGLGEERSSRFQEESLRFAALSESKEPLTEDEESALHAFLKFIVEESDKK